MLNKDEVAALPPDAQVWLVSTRDPEGAAAWSSLVCDAVKRAVSYGEFAAFRTKRDAQLWLYERKARWARDEATRLLAVARDAEKKAKEMATGLRRDAPPPEPADEPDGMVG